MYSDSCVTLTKTSSRVVCDMLKSTMTSLRDSISSKKAASRPVTMGESE